MFLNHVKTTLLLASLSGLLLLIGSLIGGQSGLHVALVMALLMNLGAYFFSDKIVLRIYRAQPLDPIRYRTIYGMVQELAERMRLPMPKLWLVSSKNANAFATGRNPKHASIALTTSIIELLDDYELRGVLAHELSHIKNRDILVGTIAATLATAIGYLASMARYAAFWRSTHHNRKNETNPIVLVIIGVCMPVIATILQLSISRSREYLADETGAHCTQEPLALASALEKISRSANSTSYTQDDFAKAATASLCIVNPLKANSILALFSTHPPLEKRIERLQKMFRKIF